MLGPGDDRLEGQAGADQLLGYAGADRLLGGAAADFLFGGPARIRSTAARGETSSMEVGESTGVATVMT
jgi:Ca2+-binding RTX toxin-like protein